MRILVVDGEADVASACERTFASEHEVVAARSGFAALDLIAIGRAFDVILCELTLPDMSGMDVHRRLQGYAPRTAAKMVFMTEDTKAFRSFLESIPNMYVQKPIVTSALRQVVRDAAMR